MSICPTCVCRQRPEISQRRGHPMYWVFPYCEHHWMPIINIHVMLLAQLFYEHRPCPAQA